MKLHNPTESLAKKEYRKQTIFQVRLLARGRQKKPAKPVAMRVHGTLHQKRYFAFLCYRGHFLLHKPGVKMMSRGLFHFSGNLIEYY